MNETHPERQHRASNGERAGAMQQARGAGCSAGGRRVRGRGACARERGTGRNAGGHGVSALKFLELLEFLQPLPKKQKHSITF